MVKVAAMATETAFVSLKREKDPHKCELGESWERVFSLNCLCYEMCLLRGSELYYARFGGEIGANVNYVWIKEICKDGVRERKSWEVIYVSSCRNFVYSTLPLLTVLISLFLMPLSSLGGECRVEVAFLCPAPLNDFEGVCTLQRRNLVSAFPVLISSKSFRCSALLEIS